MVFTITSTLGITEERGSVWKQFVLSFFACIPFFTYGIQAISLQSSVHGGSFSSTLDEVPWCTTALVISAGLSAPIYGYLVDRYGRRCGMYTVSLMQGSSCIPLFLPPNETNSLILHVIAGLSSGGLFTVLPCYIRELSDDSISAVTVAAAMVMTTAGYMFKLVLDDEGLIFLLVGLVVLQFLTMLVLVESPSYLVKVGKLEKASINISKLKCLPPDSRSVLNEMSKLQDEKRRMTANGNLSVFGVLKNPIHRDAFKIGVVLYITIILCGNIVFLDQEKVLMQLKTDFDPQKIMALSCLFAGSLFSMTVIRFVERKYLLSSAFIVMVLSMGVLAVYTQADLTVHTFRWVPVASLGILIFAYGAARGLPLVIVVEMFNFEIRAKLIAILYTISQIIKLVHIHSIKYIEEHVGIYTLFYIFACVNIYGAVYTLFAVPNLKNKSIKQIERQLKRVPLLKFNNKTIKTSCLSFICYLFPPNYSSLLQSQNFYK